MKRELIVRKTIKLNASVSEVWEALTNPEMTKKYMFGSEVVSDWKVGSPLEWKGMSEGKEVVYVKGNIVEIVQGRLLRFQQYCLLRATRCSLAQSSIDGESLSSRSSTRGFTTLTTLSNLTWWAGHISVRRGLHY